MNIEKVLDLAVRADPTTVQVLGEIGGRSFIAANGIRPQYIQKFAELLVKEAGEYLMSPEFIGRSDLDWSMVLNEHFGVEQ